MTALAGCGDTPVASGTATQSASSRESTANHKARTPGTVASAPADPGWPSLFGPDGNSTSLELGLVLPWSGASPRELWRQAIGSGYSSPVVQGNHLVVFHRQGNEEILESRWPETGEVRWQHRWPTAYACPWEYSSGPYSTPLIQEGRVYAWGAEGEFRVVELETGQLCWHRPLLKEYNAPPTQFCVSASPLVEGDLIILNVGADTGNAGIVALDKATGQTVWTATDHPQSCSTPRAATIHGRRYVFVLTETGLVSLDPTDGRVLWTLPFHSKAANSNNATSPLIADDLVLITTGPGPGALCVRVLPDGSYQEVWTDRRAIDSTWSNLVYQEGYVYGFTSRRQGTQFRCLQLATGEVVWKWSSEVDRGASLAVDGHLLLWGERGHLACLELSPEAARMQALTADPLLEPPCYAAPALHRGLLYLRSEGTLLCLDLRR